MASFPRFSDRPTLALTVGAGLLGLMGVFVCLHALASAAHLAPSNSPVPTPYPAWAAFHFAGALVFLVFAAPQFVPGLRRTRPGLHRACGRIAVAGGAVAAVAGLAIVYFAPGRTFSERVFMTTIFVAFAVSLWRAYVAARARDIPTHRAWVLRVTALALTPLSQRLLMGVFLAARGGAHDVAQFWEVFVTAAWLGMALNLLAAEAWTRRRPRARPAAQARPLAA